MTQLSQLKNNMTNYEPNEGETLAEYNNRMFIQRKKQNKKKGYIFVGISGEDEIWKKKSEIGTWTYFIDEGYPDVGFMPIWDTVRGSGVLSIILTDIFNKT